MTILPIDDARPFITVNGLPVQWQAGSAALLSLSSCLVRLSQHGVMLKPKAWRPRLTGPWLAQPCLPSALGLCAAPDGSVAFPSAQTPQVGEARDWVCGDANTQREVTNTTRYDASACDVLDAGGDYVLAGDVLYSSFGTALPVWAYWTVCALAVFLVRCLSKYVLASLTRASEKPVEYPDPLLSVLACAAATALVAMQGDFMYATEEDLIFYWFVVLYICAYGALFLGARLANLARASALADPPFYNLLAGVMQLAAVRLYCGAETPYNPPLLFVVATRVFVKSRRGCDPLRAVTLLLDSLMLGLGCTWGFSPQPQYLIALFAAAFAASDVLIV